MTLIIRRFLDALAFENKSSVVRSWGKKKTGLEEFLGKKISETSCQEKTNVDLNNRFYSS